MTTRLLPLGLGLWMLATPAYADDAPPPAPAPAPEAPVSAEEPPPAIPASSPPPPPPTGQPAAIPAPNQPTAIPDRTFQQGYLDGRAAANREPMGGWFAAGAAGGCVASGIGCLAATGAAALIEPRYNPAYYQGMGQAGQADYWSGYRDGYAKRLKSRRATSAFVGGTVATVTVGVVYMAVAGGILLSPIYID